MYYATRTCTLLPKRSETLSLLAEEVMKLSENLGALILTDDKDFGEIVFRKQRSCPGIVLLRLIGVDYSHKADQVIQVIDKCGSEMTGKFVVITEETVRMRKLFPGTK